MKPAMIAICVYTTNAAQTLRAVNLARGIIISAARRDGKGEEQQQQQREEQINDNSPTISSSSDCTIRFFTYRGSLPGGPKRTIDYEQLILQAGFDIQYFGKDDEAVLDDEMWQALLRAERNREGMFPPPYEDRATPYLQAVINTLSEFQPDVVVYGAFPEVAVACAIRGWKSVQFTPLTKSRFIESVQRFDDLCNSTSASSNYDSEKSKPKNPMERIINSARECGLELSPSASLNDLTGFINAEYTKATHPTRTMIVDFGRYYDNEDLPSDVTVVGPVLSSDTRKSKQVEDIKTFLMQSKASSAANFIKVLFTLGSTGDWPVFLEGLKALCHSDAVFRAVVLIPSKLLDRMDEVKIVLQWSNARDDVYIVDKFVPYQPILDCVDVVMCHGGLSTIQCALVAGRPIVGTPAHGEQLYNLENVQKSQAGVCILPVDWNEENIRNNLLQVGRQTSAYKEAAAKMQNEYLSSVDGAQRAGMIIWETV